MTWKASPPAIEIAAAWTAAICLGGAAGFAVARIAPLGAGLVEAGVAGVLVALAGWAMIGRVDRQRGRSLAAVETLEDDFAIEDVLLLDQPIDDEVLLLDDPIDADHDPRVVRLFAAHPQGAAAAPCAGPAEMVARIKDFLGQPRGGAAGAGPALVTDTTGERAAEDANAALHNALADIRRSLRQG